MKALKKYSGDIVKDVMELRSITKRDLSPVSLSYKLDNKYVQHLLNFMDWNLEFVVFADCDTDGLCAAAICNLYFSGDWCENIVHYKIASRNQRGFTKNDVEDILRDYPDATGILTVDCGINSKDAVDYATVHGIDCFITDHHNPSTSIPDTVIFNPKTDEHSGFREFCGTGLAYILLRETYGEEPGALQYAAIATVADMVPLISDNRYIVQKGMKEIRNPTKKHKNIDTLFSGIGSFVLNEKDIGWGIAPAINAASRLGKEEIAFRAVVFAESDAAKQLSKINDERKELVKSLYDLSQEYIQISINGASICIGQTDNSGVLGLIAMKLGTEFDLPAIAWCTDSIGLIHFSMRGNSVTDFIEYLQQFEFGVMGGGHDEAGGFSAVLGGARIIELFHEFYEQIYGKSTSQNPDSRYDIEISLIDAIQSMEDKEKLRPFGIGFDEPVFVTRNVSVIEDGLTKNKKYKRYKIGEATYIDFNNQVTGIGKFDIAYKISYNMYLKGPQIDLVELNRI